jgi:tRNA dimethylallyltransferase
MAVPFNLIAVCGPNASGKTRLGAAIARRFGGEIISVDSRQIYRGLDLGSGKDLGEYRTSGGAIPYHLIDIAGPEEIYTLWDYQRDFYRVFDEIRSRGRLPVAVGGTGLYLEAVLKNYLIPNVPEDPARRESLMKEEKEVLSERLKSLSPGLHAKTDIDSKKRIVRAIEVAQYGLSNEIQWGHAHPPEIRPLVIGVRWDRGDLRARILRRLEQRLAQGMVEEVKGLMAKGVTRGRLDLFGLEYRHIARHLAGETSLDAMKYGLFHDICRFAKRQETYFKGMERRGIPVRWVDRADDVKTVEIVETALQG